MDAMLHRGIDPRATSLKFAVCGAEPWTEEMRHELEEGMNLQACDIYGLSEVMGPGVAGESVETKDGNHIWEDHFRPEIIDPFDHTTVLPDGHKGELVFTTLTKEAMPLLRYRTGDIASLNREPCSCGRTFARMSAVRGRRDDMLIVRGINLYPSQIEEIALRIPALSPHFQLELTRSGRMDEMTIHIEPRENTTAEERSAAALALKSQIKIHVGSSCTIDVVEPGSLERSNGKLRRIYDNRPRP
jgi:phenylacetate-CoA ligase